jgi:energy-coupling factor transport system permease protein
MLRDITIGQYYPATSIIHKLDPRVKIIGTMAFVMALFMTENVLAYCLAAGILAGIIRLSTVPFKFIVKGLKPILFLILFTVSINVLFTKGHYILSFWGINISIEGLQSAAFMTSRLIMLIIGSSMMTLTTSPIQLTDGIENLLNPFKKIGLPAHELAMMMTIALRFIPTLLEETDKIMKAQMSRGADFEAKGLTKKAQSLIPILVPLFINAFRRADELAMAMEARCYRGGENRTRMKQLHYQSYDYVSYGLMGLYVAVMFWI